MAVKRHGLANRRKAAGFSQEALAEHLGVDRSTVCRWERGETEPQPCLRPGLAAALGLGPDDLDILLHRADFTPRPALNLGEHGGPAIGWPGQLLRLKPAPKGFDDDPSLHTFEHRLRQAWDSRSRARRANPCLVLVGGFAGSGKTEFGRFLSGTTGWAHLDKDALTRPLTETLLRSLGSDPNDRHTNLYASQVRPHEYRALMSAAFGSLDSGSSTVVSAPFLREMPGDPWLQRLAARCMARAIDFVLIWVDTDLETMHSHLQARDAARDTWKLNHWENYRDSVDINIRPSHPYFLVDNRQNAAVGLLDQAQRLVDARCDDW